MVEATKADTYAPSDEEKLLITLHLGEKHFVDPSYKGSFLLKQTEADRRKELVSEIYYDYQLAVNKGDYYLGQATVNFYLESMPGAGELFLEFQACAIADLEINDKAVDSVEEVFKDQRITLGAKHVQQGWNTMSVRYFNLYQKNSTGLHTYMDISDNRQYLYSQFEAFHCHRVFPCFDQPDLKAKMTLAVFCPDDWHAVSNSKEQRYESMTCGGGRRLIQRHNLGWLQQFYKGEQADKVLLYDFEQTPLISCYLYAICAGAYKMYEDFDAHYVPQRIYVRQSLDENLRKELIFGISKTTIDFYQENFGARYPFSKVDHVMCPDYKYGAMENVGCITYADSIMCNSKDMSIPQLTFICVVIQHELCHMWFGNLVTMKWWNDLWLNEAFATCLSYKACATGGNFVDDYMNESWIHMSGYKRYGLNDDTLPSNHKIQADCESTDMAESLIDGITYGKGCSMIKQLIFVMGWETFCAGLKIYFKRHAWSNTELPDFIGALQEGYDNSEPSKPLDLTDWARLWLQTKGSNKIKAEWEEADGKFTSFKLRQTHCKYADEVHRYQTFNIGLYNEDGTLEEMVENIYLQAQEVTEVEVMKGKKKTAAVLLNADDWGFGYFEMDDATTKVFEQSMAKVDNKLDRAVVIGQVIAMLNQIAYPATRLPTMMSQLMDESNQNLINALFGALLRCQGSYLPPDSVPQFNKETADFFLKKAKKDKDNKSLCQFCIDKALQFITEKEHLDLVSKWIREGKISIEGEDLTVTLTAQHKYTILKSFYASVHYTVAVKEELKNKALEGDNSDQAKNTVKVCELALPEEALKAKLWDEITDTTKECALMELKQKVAGFFQRHQQLDLIKPYFEKFYAVCEKVVKEKDREYAEIFLNGCSPAFMARDEDQKALQEILDRADKEKNFFILFLKKQIEAVDVAKRSRTLCQSS